MSQLSVDSAATRLMRFAGNSPAEIIYLQTSKGIYETGEDLWFKAYLLNAQLLFLSTESQTLYIQMCSEKDKKIVWQEKYYIENGIATGQVYIPEDLPEGNYFLEAYTRHSFYADSIGMTAIRKVRIQKNIIQGRELAVDPDDSIRLVTFPEGGYLVRGISSKLAFKVTNGHGFPVDVKGVLYEDDTPLLKFESIHAGMGSIVFTPLLGKTYQIRLHDGRSFPVSDILLQGVTMQLTEQNKDFLEFTVLQSDDLPIQSINLIGQMRGIVCCTAQGKLKKSLKIKIPLAEFQSQGIASFTLYDTNMRPVAERLVYVHPEKKLYITAEPDQKNYMIRNKVTVKIKVTDENGQPVNTQLGISVFDHAYINPADPVNILTHCYLSSQLKGSIYNPAYYFDEENPNRLIDLDLLMLTQGWSRYVWDENNLRQHGSFVVTDEINGIQTIKNKSFKNIGQMIMVSGPNGNSELLLVDSDGHFSVDTKMMKTLQGGYIYFKPMLPKEYGAEIRFDNPFLSINNIRCMKEISYPTFDLSHITREDTIRLPYVSLNNEILLREVTITGKTEQPFRDKLMGQLDSLAQMDLGPWVCECDPKHPYLNDYIEGYTHHPNENPYMKYTGKRLKPVIGKVYTIIKWVGRESNFVDERQITYNGPVYTDEELLRMNNLWRTKGYYGTREFYQPDESDMNLSIPDVRNTLLWAPTVITDANGEATVTFYCSDINTTFTGNIEGVSKEGLLGIAKFDFRVIKPQINF